MGVTLKTVDEELLSGERVKASQDGEYRIGDNVFVARAGDLLPIGAVLESEGATVARTATVNVRVTDTDGFKQAISAANASIEALKAERDELLAQLKSTEVTSAPSTDVVADPTDDAATEPEARAKKPAPSNRSKGAAPENRSA